MKKNAQQILVSLYTEESREFFLNGYDSLQLFAPELSRVGLRSIVHWLSSQGYLRVEKRNNLTVFSLTQQGRRVVEAVFPALSPYWQAWQGEWSCLTFLEAPAYDPQFRYLRKILLSFKAISLSRGVYLYPGSFPVKIMNDLEKSYITSVIIFSVQKWVFGDERLIINSKYGLNNLSDSYSGVSREVVQLIGTKSVDGGLDHQSKDHFTKAFDRFFVLLQDDIGLTTAYFSQVARPLEILSRLQSLVTNQVE